VRTWEGGGHSGGRCGVLLDVMYALLGLPAAGLLVLGRVGVFPGLLKLAVEVSQTLTRCVWAFSGPQGNVRQLKVRQGKTIGGGRRQWSRARLLGLCWVDWTGDGRGFLQ
jgi:hypothetical protein